MEEKIYISYVLFHSWHVIHDLDRTVGYIMCTSKCYYGWSELGRSSSHHLISKNTIGFAVLTSSATSCFFHQIHGSTHQSLTELIRLFEPAGQLCLQEMFTELKLQSV